MADRRSNTEPRLAAEQAQYLHASVALASWFATEHLAWRQCRCAAQRRFTTLPIGSQRVSVRFVRVEQLLEPVDLAPWLPRLDCVIVGGEIGPMARPMNPQWARESRD